MKKILIALSFFMMVGAAANAQACTKGAKSKCCAKKAAAKTADVQTSTKVASSIAEADVIAEADENIKSRTCEVSGSTSYYMKSVCEKSGTVSWDKAEFCSKSKKFTKVASASMEREEAPASTTAVKPAAKANAKTKSCKKGAKACCASKKKVG